MLHTPQHSAVTIRNIAGEPIRKFPKGLPITCIDAPIQRSSSTITITKIGTEQKTNTDFLHFIDKSSNLKFTVDIYRYDEQTERIYIFTKTKNRSVCLHHDVGYSPLFEVIFTYILESTYWHIEYKTTILDPSISKLVISNIQETSELQTKNADNNCYVAIDTTLTKATSDEWGFADSKYANNIWVRSNGYSLYYSTNGTSWSTGSLPSLSSCTIGTPVYRNNIWVVPTQGSNTYATGYGVLYSTDGKTWTQSNITSGSFRIYYLNNKWFALDITYKNTSSSSNGCAVYYSTDGKTWTKSNLQNGSWKEVYYANGVFVLQSSANTGGIYYSTNGTSWTQSNITKDYATIKYANGIWIASNNTSSSETNLGIRYSTDGKTWTQSNITSGYSSYGPYYANGIWIVGNTTTDKTHYSTDGKTWYETNLPSREYCRVCYANNTWVASLYSGSGRNYYSVDGINWTSGNTYMYYFNDPIIHINGMWLAPAGSSSYKCYASLDGINWKTIDAPGYTDSMYYKKGLLRFVSASTSNPTYNYVSLNKNVYGNFII